MNARATIRQVIQQGYGDATQTVLDDRVAADILAALREAGWASPQDVGALILAAGGEVRITAAQAMRVGTIEVEAYDDPATLDRVFRARAIR